MPEQLLKLENIYKNFGNVKVLKDVNITINKGEVVALIGDNGAGKSTLIKVITGVHTPNSGKIFLKKMKFILNLYLNLEKWVLKLFIKKELYVINKNFTEIFLLEEKLQIHLVFKNQRTKERSRKNIKRLYWVYIQSYNR